MMQKAVLRKFRWGRYKEGVFLLGHALRLSSFLLEAGALRIITELASDVVAEFFQGGLEFLGL